MLASVPSVQAGCPGTAANEIACNDDACGNFDSSVTVGVVAGETYLVRVSGYNGDTGDYILETVGPDCVAETPIAGDVDGDGDVDVTDLLALLSAWGPSPAPCPPTIAADLDGNCFVTVTDLLDLIANWGP